MVHHVTRPCPFMTTSIIIKITRVISMWTPHWITVSCHGVEGPMTTGYYCAIFPFCGGGKKKDDKKTKAFYDWATTGIPVKRQKNKGILWLGYHRYPSNYKRYERFVSVKWVFLQFSTWSPNNSLPFHGKLLRQSKVTLCPKKLSFKCLKFFLYLNWFLHMISYIFTQKKISWCRHFKLQVVRMSNNN